MHHRRILILCLIAALLGSCSPQPQTLRPATLPAPEYWPTADWKTSTPEQQGMDSATLAGLFDYVQTNQLNLHSILIIRNGYIVLEAYANPYTPEDRHTVESNTKSVVGALVGIAIHQGKIKDAQARMVDFFPGRVFQNSGRQKDSIQLGHLLSMSSGLDCADFTPPAQAMYGKRNWAGYLMDLPLVSDPGKQFAYCSGGVHILSNILQSAVGSPARPYANQFLFQPLGIAEVSETDWGSDPNGVTNGIAGLYLTPRELAKFGFLYLHRGQWDGKQIVPADWVAESTRSHIRVAEKDSFAAGLRRDFGYLFSIFPDQQFYGYLGMAGQDLFIAPAQNLVVVFNSALKPGDEGRLLPLMINYILPSVKGGSPAASAASDPRLPAARAAFAGQKLPIQPLPQPAAEASGKVFQFSENPLGWKTLSFTFQPGADTAQIMLNDTQLLQLGLDNQYRLNPAPGSRPLGLRGRWDGAGALLIDDLTLGEFPEMSIQLEFKGNELSVVIQNKNTGGDPVKLVGKLIR